MNVEQIMKLIDAGYTKDEITALTQNQEEPKEETKEEPKEETKEEIKEKIKEETKEETKVENPLDDMFASLNKSIEEFDKKLKSFNANFTEMKTGDKMQTDEDLIAKIVQPSYINKEEK